MASWINRYIVGCKYGSSVVGSECSQRINRYIVGCKFKLVQGDIEENVELIDT